MLYPLLPLLCDSRYNKNYGVPILSSQKNVLFLGVPPFSRPRPTLTRPGFARRRQPGPDLARPDLAKPGRACPSWN